MNKLSTISMNLHRNISQHLQYQIWNCQHHLILKIWEESQYKYIKVRKVMLLIKLVISLSQMKSLIFKMWLPMIQIKVEKKNQCL